MAQMSNLPEAAHLGLHYPDKYMLKLIPIFDAKKGSKVNTTHDLDSYLISAGPDELPPWGSLSRSALSR